MGVVERFADVGADLGDVAVAESVAVDQLPDGRSFNQLRDQIGAALLEVVFEEGDDSGVVEPGGGLGLALDPVARSGAGFDHLHGHVTLQAVVPGAVDGAETAGAEAFRDLEPL